MRLLPLVAVLLPGLSIGAPASLDDARAALRSLKYQDAARTLEQVSTTQNLSLAEVVDFYLLEGLVKGSLARPAPAKQAFQCALIIDPNAKLPTKVAPRVSTPFLEAKALARDHGRLAVTLSAKTQSQKGWTLDFTLGRDDLKLVKQVAFEIVEDGVSRALVVDVADLGRVSVSALKAEVSWTLRGARGWCLLESPFASSHRHLRQCAKPLPPPPRP